jgi:hypothetical protein
MSQDSIDATSELMDSDTRQFVVEFQETCRQLSELGFLSFMETLVMEILYSTVEKRIKKVCAGVYDELFLDSYCEWLDTVMVPWLQIATDDSGTHHFCIS